MPGSTVYFAKQKGLLTDQQSIPPNMLGMFDIDQIIQGSGYFPSIYVPDIQTHGCCFESMTLLCIFNNT